MKNLEIEFKWEANEARAFVRVEEAACSLGVRVENRKMVQIADVYVDTPRRDFEKKQIAMRLRNIDHTRWEATFKTRTEILNGKAVRREETCTLPNVKNQGEALQRLQEKKYWNGLNVSQLCPLFILRNKRKIQTITFKNTQAELTFDTCQLIICGRKVSFKEIELELKKGSVDALEKLAFELTQRTKLKPARVSKVKTAVALLRLWEEKNEDGISDGV